ncbi:MAG: hypothetical protein ACRAS9_00005, partial [Mycoplasma sp.]
KKPFGDRPRRNFGERREFNKPDGEFKPRREFGDRPERSFDRDKKPFGDRPRRNFGERREFGKSDRRDNKRSFDKNKKKWD